MKTKVRKSRREKFQVKGGKEKLSLLGTGISNMTYRDMKRRAICLGMPFPEACNADFGMLHSYIIKTENKPDKSLIDKYDDWVDNILKERGYSEDDPLRNYQLRLGYLGEDKASEQRTFKKKDGRSLNKLPKPKREKDSSGLWTGTKKSYTYELCKKGHSLERVKRRVLKAFPDANLKSVQQWYRNAKRELENGK